MKKYSDIKEETLQAQGFISTTVTKEESGYENDYYYYSLDIGDICLITNAQDEAVNDGWVVSIFDSMTNNVTNEEDLITLVGIIKRSSTK
jgi:hypothetical protein